MRRVRLFALPFRLSLQAHIRRGRSAEVEEQLQRGADPDRRDWQGNTPLLIAARDGHAQLVERLLAAGASVHLKDRQHGMTALMWAALRGHEAVVEQLLQAGADPTLADRYGKDAAGLAREYGHSEIAALLLERQVR